MTGEGKDMGRRGKEQGKKASYGGVLAKVVASLKAHGFQFPGGREAMGGGEVGELWFHITGKIPDGSQVEVRLGGGQEGYLHQADEEERKGGEVFHYKCFLKALLFHVKCEYIVVRVRFGR